jgi:two-component system nitrogen regulation response regulator GlnG
MQANTEKKNDIGQIVYDILERYFEQHNGSIPPPGLYKRVINEVERPLLFLTLRAVSGNQQKAAKILGINRNTLRKKVIEMMKNRESAKVLQKFAEHF